LAESENQPLAFLSSKAPQPTPSEGEAPPQSEARFEFQRPRWFRARGCHGNERFYDALGLRITDLDLAYIAGYVDGEGHIAIAKVSVDAPSCKRAGLKSPQYRLRVEIANTTIQTLEWIQSLFGGPVVQSYHKKPNPRGKRCWRWCCGDGRAYRFLGTIAPFLRQKKPQAALALAYWETKNREVMNLERTNSARISGTTPLSATEVAKREDFYQRMKKLNKRGANA